MPHTQPCAPDHTSDEELADLLRQAGVRKTDQIRVTGPSGLATLLWLCRRGYDEVGYLRPDLAAGATAPDALIVARTCDDQDLRALLSKGPLVRKGGILVFQTAQDTAALRHCLDQFGFVVEQRRGDDRRQILAARRLPAASRKAA